MISCKRCQSTEIIKQGKTPAGKQTYKCKACIFHFVPDELIERSNNPTCTDCGLAKLQKIGKYKGRQRWRCNKCKKSYVDKSRMLKTNNPFVLCPECGSNKNYSNGNHTGSGNKRYRCKECNRNFTISSPQ